VRGAERWPDRPWWLTGDDAPATRAQVYESARRVAGGLRARGVGPGDHVVLCLPNGLDFVRAWFGTMLAGGIAVGVNPAAAQSELPAVTAAVRAAVVVAGAETAAPPGVRTVQVGELDAATAVAPVDGSPDRPASYIQSSGSTGEPKFVIETHAMYTLAAEAFPFWLGLTEEDVLLTTLPLSHLNAQTYSTLGSYGLAAGLVMLPRFSASTFWADARRYGATEFNAIGAMLEILMAQEPSAAERDHSVRLCYLGPAPTGERHREMEERFGFRLVIGYALSETPFGLVSPIDRPPVYESMGRPRQHPRLGQINEARIVDAAGQAVEPGVVGELLLHNPVTTPGYHNLPEETAKALPGDGWLRTGDLATCDEDGNYFFAGRVKETIRRRGENLSPAEVENAINSHPAVSASAVIGVPSPLTEEDIKAFVMLRSGASLSSSELVEWWSERLPPYKRPRYVEFVDEWPLTETQKIAKPKLSRERTAAETDLETIARQG
jgi:crotonobetaine/carnitine-CoA ligase